MDRRVGIFVHCRNLSSLQWERLVWGIPEQNKLGDIPTLVEIILTQKMGTRKPLLIIGEGPSEKDGLKEGSYAKQFAINHIDELVNFPRINALLKVSKKGSLEYVQDILNDMLVSEPIQNTKEETTAVAGLFAKHDINTVYEIAAATHASRCIKEQSVARAAGIIPKTQRWFLTPTDMSYAHTKPSDVAVIEPLHRLDQGSLVVGTELARNMNEYYTLDPHSKAKFVELVSNYFRNR